MKFKVIVLISTLMVSLSLMAQKVPDKSTITSFSQDSAANCASISVIKLAIAKYGVDGVFKKVDSLADRYRIQLLDDKIIELTKNEEAIMGKIDGFAKGNNEMIFTKAKFIYAVMAKNKMKNYDTSCKKIEDAATRKDLSKPNKIKWLLEPDTKTNLSYLGLENLYDSIKVAFINNYKSIIITNYYHSAYSSFGFYDEHGRVRKNCCFTWRHGHWLKPLNTWMNYVLKD